MVDRQEAAAATGAQWEATACLLYRALNGIYVEEINGRLCAMPETLPDLDNDEAPRESRCCPSCLRHWKLTKKAIRAYNELVPHESSAASVRGEGIVLGRPGVNHYTMPHDYRASTEYGYGTTVEALCGRTSGIAYDEGLVSRMFPEDRICKFCERVVFNKTTYYTDGAA